MNPISLRINYLVKNYFDNNNSKFAEKALLSEANVRNYRKGILPKLDFLVNIYENANVSFEWVLTGNGEPILENKPVATSLEEPTEKLAVLQEKLSIKEERVAYYLEVIDSLRSKISEYETEKKHKEVN